MKAIRLILFCCLSAASSAQNATPTPAKDPFKGWGTSLDKSPNKPGATLKPAMPPQAIATTPMPTAPGAASGGGIVLGKTWSAPLPLSSGGHSLDIRDLGRLLRDYGKPGEDLAPHPEVKIDRGVTYLMPLAQAEQRLGLDPHALKTRARVACAGFPDGLTYIGYDVKAGIYQRLYIVTDLADQVVCIEYVAPNVVDAPPSPPWRVMPGEWHVYDYVNDRTKGQPRIEIDTRVLDRRNDGQFIVVNTTGRAVNQTATWHVPQPLINLILYCAGKLDAN